jgi:hypothetical protein
VSDQSHVVVTCQVLANWSGCTPLIQ